MRLLMAVLADRSEVVDGKTSVIGLFQSVVAQAFPTELSGYLVVRIALDADEDDPIVDVEARLVHESGAHLGTVAVPADVPPRSLAHPLRGIDLSIELTGTRLPEPGRYWFEIRARRRLLTRVPLVAQRLSATGRA